MSTCIQRAHWHPDEQTASLQTLLKEEKKKKKTEKNICRHYGKEMPQHCPELVISMTGSNQKIIRFVCFLLFNASIGFVSSISLLENVLL